MIRFLGFKFGSMVDIMPHEANEMYDTQIQNELGLKLENLQLTNTEKPLLACQH